MRAAFLAGLVTDLRLYLIAAIFFLSAAVFLASTFEVCFLTEALAATSFA